VSTPPFPQLQAFLVVARHRSFSSAARELGVSRSAVSQAVRQLEEQLRVVLLARTTRSVSLTEAGRRLVDGAGPSVGQLVAALADVAAQPGETVGRLRLSVPRAVSPPVSEGPTFAAIAGDQGPTPAAALGARGCRGWRAGIVATS
jgi:DNA-binding transcriptional LysR family regulator